MGRPPKPGRTAADKDHADRERERYRTLPPAEKRRIVVERDREAQRDADARRYERGKAERQTAAREYQRGDRASGAHDQERKARATVRLAEAHGTLKRPVACQECGTRGPVHAHHSDHSKPTDVRYLCTGCHGEQGQVGYLDGGEHGTAA